MSERLNEVVRNQPVADFYYKGPSHSHPVRRRVVIVNLTRTHVSGYELREGHLTREIDEAPFKTYRRDRIATRGQCRLESKVRRVSKTRLSETTFNRKPLQTLVN